MIGDPGVGTYSSTRGAAYIYQPDISGKWVQKQRITVDDEWQFGSCVNLLGNTLAVSSSGGVYLFEADPATGIWQAKQKLPTPVDYPNGAFGASLAVGDGVVLVGAPGEDDVEFESLSHGAVYFFKGMNQGSGNLSKG